MAAPDYLLFKTSVVVTLTITAWMWVISLAGLAGVQQTCADHALPQAGLHNAAGLAGVRGFSATVLHCAADGKTTVFGYYWFIVALQVVLIASLGLSIVFNCAHKARAAWVGLFSVAALLYIQFADSSLTMLNVSDYASNQPMHRAKTLAAGTVGTAVANLLLILALGTDLDSVVDGPAE